MKIRILALILLAAVLAAVSGCSRIEANAAILNDNASEWIAPGFYESHYTRGAYYGDECFDDPSLPETRIFLVRDREGYDEIFTPEAGIDVDFSREMLLVCTFTAHYVRPVGIVKLSAGGDLISAELKMKDPRGLFQRGVGDACRPYQRYVILKLDKSEAERAEFRIS